MRIFITGAGGFVGQHLCERLDPRNEVIALPRGELDITNAADVDSRISSERPDIIVNCAVLGVEACEADPEKARAVNIEGSANLARAAAKFGAAVIQLSTNYVFDGSRETGFCTTDDEAKPVNVYGRTKLEGERAVLAACERSYIVRTSWVFGGSGKGFFDKAVRALSRGERVEAVSDNWASATLVTDLADRLEEIVQIGRYGIYHVANSGVCSKYEFAVEAARLMDRDPDKLVVPVQADASLSTRRPRYTPMNCKLSGEIGLAKMRDWRTALKEYISEIVH